jgi:hypothetical protein
LKIVGTLGPGYYRPFIEKDLSLGTTTWGILGMPYHLSAVGQYTSTDFNLGSTVHPHKAFHYISIANTEGSSSVTSGAAMEMVHPYDIIEATYTGTASTDFVAGCQNIKISTAGSATGTTGPVPPVLSTSTNVGSTAVLEHAYIHKVDATNSKVYFYFRKLSTGA